MSQISGGTFTLTQDSGSVVPIAFSRPIINFRNYLYHSGKKVWQESGQLLILLWISTTSGITCIDSGNPEEEFCETQSNNSSPSPNQATSKLDSPSQQPISAAGGGAATNSANSSIYAKAQEALRAHYQHMGLIMLWISKLIIIEPRAVHLFFIGIKFFLIGQSIYTFSFLNRHGGQVERLIGVECVWRFFFFISLSECFWQNDFFSFNEPTRTPPNFTTKLILFLISLKTSYQKKEQKKEGTISFPFINKLT